MKKTTVRFAAVGTVLLLSALAIALAQHDSRLRSRDIQPTATSNSEAPQPILVDAIDPTFHGVLGAEGMAQPSAPLVRANDDPAPAAPPSLQYAGDSDATANPLRSALPTSLRENQTASLGAEDDQSSVEQASGEDDATSLRSSLPAIPSLSAPFGAQPLPADSMPSSPPSLSTALPNASAPSAALPSATLPGAALPDSALPSVSSSTEPSALPNAPPGWVNSGALAPKQNLSRQSLSDTQRPAMPATNLPAARSGEQPWLQAPPIASGGSSLGGAGSVLPPGTAGMDVVGTSPAGGAQGGAPFALPSATHSRLSDAPDSSAAGGQGRELPSPASMQVPASQVPAAQVPTAQGLGSQGLGSQGLGSQGLGAPNGSAMPTLGDRPLAPAATLGTPLPPASAPDSAAEQSLAPVISSRPNNSLSSAQPRGQLASGSGRSLLAGSALGSLVSNQPGNRHLDGSQNPIMLIQKRTAGECQVGKRATIVITVRNSGNATAHDVQVIDSVPSGASFAEAIPAVTPTPEGVLVWQLGEMGPGDERTINMQIIPERQGELGSVASVRFAAQASVRTLATLPKIELAYTAAPEVLIGSQHAIDVLVKNVGTGVAHNVRLEADLPANIRHESGDAGLEASFGDIAPGESKHIRLDSIAAEAGNSACTIRALTDDGLQQEQKVDVHVLAPALQATINGPSKRYLDRQATFEIAIQNTGTAPATNCEFALRLPAGLNFNTANNQGVYDPEQHAVLWSLPELPAGKSGSVEVTVLPVEIGTLAMTFQAMAELGTKAEARGELSVEEQAELAFTIEQDADPIELSASTTYTVEVRNIGRADHNVQLIAQLPPGSKILKVDAPVKYSIQGDQLLFEPLPQMDSRTGHKFRFEVQHAQAGTQIVRAQLKSQNRPTPVIKEEATDVYDDRN